tara:strand:+ start:176 stop:703 length:528 start_codon:yes stop_codon:yes gene_type:complete
MSEKTIFLDRDGVINKEVSYLYKIDDFEFIKGVFTACQHFQSLGYQIIIVTNQSGIFRKFYSFTDYLHLTNWMLDKFRINKINITDIFYCPHGPKSNCNCRKPKPGMLLEAKKKYGIDMEKSWMIGDKEDDIIAANSAGIKNTILVKSGHQNDLSNSNAKFILRSIDQSKDIIIQ